MPLYEFHCDHCDQNFESYSKPNDPVQCKFCRSIHVVKLISAPNYKWNCDPGGSTNPRARANLEEARKEGKRERLSGYYESGGKWKK